MALKIATMTEEKQIFGKPFLVKTNVTDTYNDKASPIEQLLYDRGFYQMLFTMVSIMCVSRQNYAEHTHVK